MSGGDIFRGDSARVKALLSDDGKPAAEKIAEGRLDIVTN